MKFMGIDQSLTSTGVVVVENKKFIYSDVVRTSKTDLECPYADTLERAQCIAQELSMVVKSLEISNENIQLEGLSYGSVGNATRNLAMLFGVLCNSLELSQPKTIAPTSLKKWATGRGDADKAMMLEAVRLEDPEFYNIVSQIPVSRGRYDIVDAYHLARNLEDRYESN